MVLIRDRLLFEIIKISILVHWHWICPEADVFHPSVGERNLLEEQTKPLKRHDIVQPTDLWMMHSHVLKTFGEIRF